MKIRVLLADDHAMLREGLKALLSASADIEVVAEAADGREALAQAEALAPDVAVLDIAMPGLNGIEAARVMRRRFPAMRIVMLSMHSSSEHVHRALEAGAQGYLLKESAADEVGAAVRAVHAGARYFSRALGAFPREARTQPGPLARLSARERQVLQLVVEGHSSTEIAARIHLSPKSVATYRSRLMKKLGVADIAALVKFAVQHGLTPPS